MKFFFTLFSVAWASSNQNQTILQNLFTNNRTSIFASLLSLPDFRNITNQLHSPNNNNITLFAPSDESFKKAGVSNSSSVSQNVTLKDLLYNWLDYHIVANETYLFPSEQGLDNQTANNSMIYMYHEGSQSQRRILKTSLVRFASETGNQTSSSSTAGAGSNGNQTSSISSNYTSNQVLIVDPYTNQIIHGNPSQPANVTQANQISSNGVFHVIDDVLEVPQNITNALSQLNQTDAWNSLSQNDTSMADSSQTLMTFFIPSNQAIQSQPSSSSNSSLNLQDYFVNGTAYYSPLFFSSQNQTNQTSQQGNQTMEMQFSIQLASGKNLSVTMQNDTFLFNGTRSIYSDVLVENGVVYVIDGLWNNSTQGSNSTQAMNIPSLRRIIQ